MMSCPNAEIVISILLEDDTEADRLASFMREFPDHIERAKAAWKHYSGREWED